MREATSATSGRSRMTLRASPVTWVDSASLLSQPSTGGFSFIPSFSGPAEKLSNRMRGPILGYTVEGFRGTEADIHEIATLLLELAMTFPIY